MFEEKLMKYFAIVFFTSGFLFLIGTGIYLAIYGVPHENICIPPTVEHNHYEMIGRTLVEKYTCESE